MCNVEKNAKWKWENFMSMSSQHSFIFRVNQEHCLAIYKTFIWAKHCNRIHIYINNKIYRENAQIFQSSVLFFFIFLLLLSKAVGCVEEKISQILFFVKYIGLFAAFLITFLQFQFQFQLLLFKNIGIH